MFDSNLSAPQASNTTMNSTIQCKDHPNLAFTDVRSYMNHFNRSHETLIGRWPISKTMCRVVGPNDGRGTRLEPIEPVVFGDREEN